MKSMVIAIKGLLIWSPLTCAVRQRMSRLGAPDENNRALVSKPKLFDDLVVNGTLNVGGKIISEEFAVLILTST